MIATHAFCCCLVVCCFCYLLWLCKRRAFWTTIHAPQPTVRGMNIDNNTKDEIVSFSLFVWQRAGTRHHHHHHIASTQAQPHHTTFIQVSDTLLSTSHQGFPYSCSTVTKEKGFTTSDLSRSPQQKGEQSIGRAMILSIGLRQRTKQRDFCTPSSTHKRTKVRKPIKLCCTRHASALV